MMATPTPAHEGQAQFTRLDLMDGLSHNTVDAILQDHLGFMWFGTWRGLNRYDGQRFRTFFHDPKNPRSISHDNINSMVEDKNGSLWLGSWGGGLNRFDRDSETFWSLKHDPDDNQTLASNFIMCLWLDQQDVLWIGSNEGGLNRFDPETQTVSLFSQDAEGEPVVDRIRSLCGDGDQRLWVGTDRGLWIFNRRRAVFEAFKIDDQGPFNLNEEAVICLYLGSSRKLWVGAQSGYAAVNLVTGRVDYFPHEQNNLAEERINVIYEDPVGNHWVGYRSSGLYHYDAAQKRGRRFQAEPRVPFSLGGDDIRAVYEDRSGNLWVGTRNHGISKLNLKPPKFRVYRAKTDDEQGFPSGEISAVVSARNGGLWLGTRTRGVTLFERRKDRFSHFRHQPGNPKSLSQNRVISLCESKSGILWVGTSKGLNRKQPGSAEFKTYRHDPRRPDTLPDDRVSCLLEDKQERLWVGTSKGLARLDGEAFVNHLNRPGDVSSISKGMVHAIYEDQNGTIWVGLGPGGLNRWDRSEQRFSRFNHDPKNPQSLSDDTVMCILELRGTLWVGTFGGGLNRFEAAQESFRSYTQQNGLPSNAVYGLLADHKGRLWLSTNKGLSRFSPQEEQFRNYDLYDGLQSDQFTHGAFHKSRTGEFFFGGILGLNSFFPERVQDDYYIPPLVFSGFYVNDRLKYPELKHDQTLVLHPEDNFWSVEFAVLDYTRPEKNRYLYMLKGWDQDWIESSNGASVSYAGIRPGDYSFQVKGANHDGIWNEYGLALNLRIVPPLYRTWWAYLLGGALLMGLMGATFLLLRSKERSKARIQLLEESEKLAVEANKTKNVFVAHMSHELRTPLNAILGYTEILLEDLEEYDRSRFDPEQWASDLTKIKSAAYYQLSQVNNLLELTRIESGKSQLLVEPFDIRTAMETVLLHIQPMLEKTGNQLDVHFFPQEIGTMIADLGKVQSIILNLLTNANKFTEKGQISLSVTRFAAEDVEEIGFQVRDTGVGISPEQLKTIFKEFSTAGDSSSYQGSGLGLYISRYYIKMMGGAIDVESQLSQGATFIIRLPAEVSQSDKTLLVNRGRAPLRVSGTFLKDQSPIRTN